MQFPTNLAAQGYQALRPATQPTEGTAGVAETIRSAATSFQDTLAQAEKVSIASMTGDADPHSLVQALTQAELAVETAVTVRNKVVEAYQEILRMPI
ncbi:MAG: flagellar hook-basal body complex protein FliE [Rhodobacteraceae bacterium]|nr:flagellar hook-basal body complex protein FliE [Paracoccaceae bacterium]MCW9042514.1 flagellar hook-basal body complex protein FliE [Pseudopelagicola sp.]